MEFLQILVEKFEFFTLISIRIFGLFLVAPFWGNRNIPPQVKVFLSLVISLMILPVVDTTPVRQQGDLVLLGIAATMELMIGLIIGILGRFLFAAIQMAGRLVGIQMMLSMVDVVDPDSEVQISVIGEVKFIIAFFIFMIIGGHHIFVRAIVTSFQVAPMYSFNVTGLALAKLAGLLAQIFLVALQVAGPVYWTLVITEVCLGIVSRSIPEMNVLFIGMPLKIGIGFFSLGFTFSYMARYLLVAFAGLEDIIKAVLILMSRS